MQLGSPPTPQDPDREAALMITRRHLFGRVANSIGAAALASLHHPNLVAAPSGVQDDPIGAAHRLPHFAPEAKRVIYLFQSGGPSSMDLFNYKPKLAELHGKELPPEVRKGQRVTNMTAKQKSFPMVAPMFKFAQHGQCGRWLSELLPHTASIVDDITLIQAVHTEAINHDPAITFINTGSQQPGSASLGAWLSYGLGSESENLPAYVVLISRGSAGIAQPLFSRLWSSGFLPSSHQGVRFRTGKDPVLFLSDPPGIDKTSRKQMLDALAEINRMKAAAQGDPEIHTRIASYEMAFRMQTSVPELMDLSDESEATFEMYGPESRRPGSYAANCLQARRMAERGVRFIQLFHRGWDHHGNLPREIRKQCQDTDQASAALISDLKMRGMLDETLVIWGGEFGRTVYCQGGLTNDNYGRDHHGRCFSMWMAGGGIKAGHEHGETDDYCYNVVNDGVHIRDINATVLHCLGIDHEKLIFPFQGLNQRLTGVEDAHVVGKILA
jgi:hypothetical protein